MPQNLIAPGAKQLMDIQLDISIVDGVQVQVDDAGRTLWVNVNGVCVLRISQAALIDIDID